MSASWLGGSFTLTSPLALRRVEIGNHQATCAYGIRRIFDGRHRAHGKDEPIGTQEPRDGSEYLYRLVKDLS